LDTPRLRIGFGGLEMPCFVVSVPFDNDGNKNVQDQFRVISSKLSTRPTHFEVPNLKVGTLDNLMECSDDLFKIDGQVESITFKILNMLEEISGSTDLANVTKPGGTGSGQTQSVEEYLVKFQWNDAQYPINKPLKQLIQSIQEQVTKGEENIRSRYSDYNEIKTRLASIKKKSGGSLAVKPVASIIKSWYRQHGEDGPVQSDSLTTLFVAVPSAEEKRWLKEYTTINGTPIMFEIQKGKVSELTGVVPDSSKCIAKEADYCLYNVIVMHKVVDSYKQALRENKYMIREYLPDEEVTDEAYADLSEQADKKKNALVRWLMNTFSESYSGWIHLKSIRVFVESILRFGLPPDFVPMLFHVDSAKEKAVRKQLGSMYQKLNPKKYAMDDESDSFQALEQQYPYVSLKIKGVRE